MRRTYYFCLMVFLFASWSAGALAQTMPTGTLTGKISDPSGLAVPGATVTVTSPSLQGSREAVSSANGDYAIPFLPPGEYSLAVGLSGFESQTRKVRVLIAATQTANVQLSLGGVTEAVEVRAAAQDFSLSAGVTSSLKAETVNTLPVARDLTGAALLAPGTTDAGFRGSITFNGALSYEGLFLVNGVVVNETVRGTARDLFIEDSIEETKTSTSSISAEFGRFTGGVVNTITKSGGNTVSGSLRTTLNDETWRNRTPFELGLSTDSRVNRVTPTHEATLGGPVFKDRVWYFLAGRYVNQRASESTAFTNKVFERGTEDARVEGKVTWSITPKHTIRSSFTMREQTLLNNYQSTPFMDLKYLWNETSQQEDLLASNYSGVLRANVFVEAQYSRRRYFIIGEGSDRTDLINGTVIYDSSRGLAKWNAPASCSVCGPGGAREDEERNNQNVVVKGTWFLSTGRAGSHNVVFGGDVFQDGRLSNVYAAGGSSYRLYIGETIIREGQLYPSIVPNVAYFQWNPVEQKAIPQDLRTYSAFVNDDWRLGQSWAFNLGLRWDTVDAEDQAGSKVIKHGTLSPRLSATFTPGGTGPWTVNAGAARYVMTATSNIVNLGSAAGKQSVYQFNYQGPAINSNINAPTLVSTADALTATFDWFFSNGGTTRPFRRAPTLPGVNRRAGDGLITPGAWEYNLGIGRELGAKGSVRLEAVYRKYGDFYADRKDVSTGKVADKTGALYDLGLVVNSNAASRDYRAIMAQFQYRLAQRVSLGGNYTLSKSHGDFEGENDTTGAITDITLSYPEYIDKQWGSPEGDLASDQRHKVRVWASYTADLGRAGMMSVGVVQRLTSGKPFGAIGTIDSRPYVTNPGYLTPPATVNYFFTGRDGFRTDAITATDLAINYERRLGLKNARLFGRFVIDNILNQSGYNAGGTRLDVATVLTNTTVTSLARFNPFTEKPVEGVHYRLPNSFGKPLSNDDYQIPRRFTASVGLRF